MTGYVTIKFSSVIIVSFFFFRKNRICYAEYLYIYGSKIITMNVKFYRNIIRIFESGYGVTKMNATFLAVRL